MKCLNCDGEKTVVINKNETVLCPACEGAGTHEAVEELAAAHDEPVGSEAAHVAARLRCVEKYTYETQRQHVTEAADLIERQAAEIQMLKRNLKLKVTIGAKTFSRTDMDELCRRHDIECESRGNVVLVRGTRQDMRIVAKRLHEAGNPDDGWLLESSSRRYARHAREKVLNMLAEHERETLR